MNQNYRRKTEKVYVKVTSDFNATGYIRKSRIVNLRLPDGEARRKGIDSTKYLWVAKLRCRYGSSYRM